MALTINTIKIQTTCPILSLFAKHPPSLPQSTCKHVAQISLTKLHNQFPGGRMCHCITHASGVLTQTEKKKQGWIELAENPISKMLIEE